MDENKENIALIIKLVNLCYTLCLQFLEEKVNPDYNFVYKLRDLKKIYGIKVLRDLYSQLSLAGYQNANSHYVTLEDAINDMSADLSFLAFYIFSKDSKSLKIFPVDHDQDFDHDPTVYLLDVMVAHTLNSEITDTLKTNNFVVKVQELAANTHQEITYRELTHAIYHQASPYKHLYIREFLQNALDAVKDNNGRAFIDIEVGTDKFGSCVLKLQDPGVGMSLEEVFRYFLIPGASSKRDVKKGEFIGGRGVGVFAAFHGAKNILIKTSKGDGYTHYFKIIPYYEKNEDGQLQVINAEIKWHTFKEDFKGTMITRTTLDHENVLLNMATYQRSLQKHAQFIDANKALILVNGHTINNQLMPLVVQNIPDLGLIKFYKGSDNVMTAGGLYINHIPSEFFNLLPETVVSFLCKYHIVIDFPSSTPLNRERNNFEDSKKFYELVIPYITQGFINTYITLFSNELVSISELPYDFFERFKINYKELLLRNPNVERDAEIINSGSALPDYSIYKDMQKLTDLMCLLKLIPHTLVDKYGPAKFSLVKLAQLNIANSLTNIDQLPSVIRQQIQFSKLQKSFSEKFSRTVNNIDLTQDPNRYKKSWNFADLPSDQNWKLLRDLSEQLLFILNKSQNKIKIWFSTEIPDALALTHSGSQIVYINPVYMETPILINLSHSFEKNDYDLFSNTISDLIKTLSHELVHVHDEPCTGTHNHEFYNRQAKILREVLPTINYPELFKEYKALYTTLDVGTHSSSATTFIKSQLDSYLSRHNRCI